jgi:thiamine kinase
VFKLAAGQKALLDEIEPLRGARILEKLAGGPASDSWLLMVGDDKFVARLDKPLAGLLGLDRAAEPEVLQIVSAAGIGPQIIWANAEKGVLVTSYIPGNAWSRGDIHDPARLVALATCLRQLHALPPGGPVFTPGKVAMGYARQAATHKATRIAQQTSKLADKLLSGTRRPALCHNDLVHSNIIGGETVRLIDWEYAAIGDPYFDLATVVRHHQLEDDRIDAFLGAYFGTPGKDHFLRLQAFCRLYDQLAALWYLSVTTQAGHDTVFDEELQRVLARLQ